MSFFTRKQKKLAISCDRASLEKGYHITEQNLKNVARSGNERHLRKAMKKHGEFEHALLYQNTPEYKNKKNKRMG